MHGVVETAIKSVSPNTVLLLNDTLIHKRCSGRLISGSLADTIAQEHISEILPEAQ